MDVERNREIPRMKRKMKTRYYVNNEALKLKEIHYFKALCLDDIKRHANDWVDGIYYEQDDMDNYLLYVDPEDSEKDR